jgi:hypothetical protein
MSSRLSPSATSKVWLWPSLSMNVMWRLVGIDSLESWLLGTCVGIFLLFAWFWRCEIAVVGLWSRGEGSARRW